MSDITRKKRFLSRLTFWLSIALTLVPSAVFVVQGFIEGDTSQKVCIGFTAVAALIIFIFSLFSKVNMRRSIFWVLIFGMIALFDRLGTMFIIVGVCQMVDEIIVEPLHHRFKEDYHTNKQIDKREKR